MVERYLKLTKPNMRGEDVRYVQQRLGLNADGIFGPDTERAVKRF
jgi:peptidoglycan hydrolase-like protein with peptidoglycan-binding domain